VVDNSSEAVEAPAAQDQRSAASCTPLSVGTGADAISVSSSQSMLPPQLAWRRGLRWFAAEFLVVVSGILVALALQAWWNNRAERIEERALLQRLLIEFVNNRKLFDEVDQRQQDVIAKAKRLLQLTGPQPGKIADTSFESLVASMINDLPTYDASTNELQAMLGSGQLALIRNDVLRGKIAAWREALDQLNGTERTALDEVVHGFVPYLLERVPFQNLDRSSGLITSQVPSRFTSDYESLRTDMRFENHVENRWALAVFILRRAATARGLMDDIIRLIERELDGSAPP
jgi:hypothetical protein